MGAYQSRHPACSFLRKKVTAREGGGCFVWAKDRWTLRAAETQKEGHLTDVLLFWKGRLKLIFPLNETAAQRCELALTYKKSEQAIQSLLRCGAGYGSRTRLLGLGSRCTTDVLTLQFSRLKKYSISFPVWQENFTEERQKLRVAFSA